MQDNERLVLNVAQAAELLQLSRASTYQGCLDGTIPCVKVGKRILIPRVRLIAWLEGGEKK